MNNFVRPGEVCTFTAPSGGVVSGTGYLIGTLFVVATISAAVGTQFEGCCIGEVILPKASGAWTEGALVYWDDTAKNVTTTSTSNTRIGCAAQVGGQASGDTTGLVRLNGTAAPTGA